MIRVNAPVKADGPPARGRVRKQKDLGGYATPDCSEMASSWVWFN